MVAPPEMDVFTAGVEAAGEAILITSAELDEPGPHIEHAIPAFTRMTGYEAHEVLGRLPRLLQGPRTERAVLNRLRASLEAGECAQGEALNYRKDGTTYMVEWLITPMRDTDGRITRWVSAPRDITERRAAEDRQNLLVRELHHRVKNTLATVQAVLNASLRSSLGLAEFRQAFTGRIASLAQTHALITDARAQADLVRGAPVDGAPRLRRARTDARLPERATGRARVGAGGPGRHGSARDGHERHPPRCARRPGWAPGGEMVGRGRSRRPVAPLDLSLIHI